MSNSSFSLLSTKKFRPFFFTQFLGAFNDNLFKQALITIISFGSISLGTSDTFSNPNTLNNIGALLFILPFFLFSALAGQLADKYEKSLLVRRVKLIEIVIMVGAAIGFYLNNVVVLLIVLFFMGTQSAFFGPVKFSIIPQHLDKTELVQGNALVEMGTFIAIILGYILGVLLVIDNANPAIISGAVIFFAALGWYFSRGIPEAPSSNKNLQIDWNLFRQSFYAMSFAAKERSVFYSVIGISWFWFLGATYMTQLPIFVKEYLHGTEKVYVFLLTLFSVGIGLGSILCERLSKEKLEIGLVPIGSIGLSLFGLDLYLASTGISVAELTLDNFFQQAGAIRIVIDFLGLGVMGGLYIVPLFTLVQERSEITYRARVIAANNILNALFMVSSAVCGILIVGILKYSIPQLFLFIALLNIMVALVIYLSVPEFIQRFLILTKINKESTF